MTRNTLLSVVKILVCASLFFIPVTEGCGCFPKHEQNKFCDADIVVHAKFTSSDDTGTDLNYQVKIIESFKGNFRKNSIQPVVSPGPLNSCSVSINVTTNPEYLLGGKKQNGKLSMDGCSWRATWSSVTDCVKARLGSISGYDLYKDTCNTCKGAKCSKCQIQLCLDSDTVCKDEANNNSTVCLLTYNNLRSNDICIEDNTGSCYWQTCTL